eukprot:6381994-Amphidinium_carterae.1
MAVCRWACPSHLVYCALTPVAKCAKRTLVQFSSATAFIVPVMQLVSSGSRPSLFRAAWCQARTAPKQKQRYINDAVRSDFHRKFLQKYVWVLA